MEYHKSIIVADNQIYVRSGWQKPLWEAAKKQENVVFDSGPEKAGAPRP